jgi:hypothetical protein
MILTDAEGFHEGATRQHIRCPPLQHTAVGQAVSARQAMVSPQVASVRVTAEAENSFTGVIGVRKRKRKRILRTLLRSTKRQR